MRQRLLVAPQRTQNLSEISVRNGITGGNSNDLLVCLRSFYQAPSMNKNQGQIMQSTGMALLELEDRPVMPLGFVKFALSVQQHGGFIMLPGGPAGL
ncbi:MAG: hypothetical protein WCA78_15195 [Rhizomicrobium sp.]